MLSVRDARCTRRFLVVEIPVPVSLRHLLDFQDDAYSICPLERAIVQQIPCAELTRGTRGSLFVRFDEKKATTAEAMAGLAVVTQGLMPNQRIIIATAWLWELTITLAAPASCEVLMDVNCQLLQRASEYGWRPGNGGSCTISGTIGIQPTSAVVNEILQIVRSCC
jgi:hypothetical protein